MLKTKTTPQSINQMARSWTRINHMPPAEIENEIFKAAKPVLEQLVKNVKSRFTQLGHPELAAHVTWWRTEDNVHVGIAPGEPGAKALTLEFGTSSAAPTPVLRTVINEEYKRLSAQLNAALQRQMFQHAH